MNKKNQSGYHHGDLQQQLLAVAIKHLQGGGVEALSLRAIARELGVSQTAPYRHFKDKSALLAALASGGFSALAEEMSAAITSCRESPSLALQLSGMAYIRFARQNPEIYQLMFGQRMIESQNYPELMKQSKECYKVLQNIVESGMEQGAFKSQSAEMLANTAWALVHGLATLIIDRLQWTMSEKDIEKQIEISTKILGPVNTNERISN